MVIKKNSATNQNFSEMGSSGNRTRDFYRPSTGYEPVRKGGSPQDLGVGVVLHLVLVGLLGVEAEALAGASAACATGALLRRSFTNGGDQERLHADARVVHLQQALHVNYICDTK